MRTWTPPLQGTRNARDPAPASRQRNNQTPCHGCEYILAKAVLPWSQGGDREEHELQNYSQSTCTANKQLGKLSCSGPGRLSQTARLLPELAKRHHRAPSLRRPRAHARHLPLPHAVSRSSGPMYNARRAMPPSLSQAMCAVPCAVLSCARGVITHALSPPAAQACSQRSSSKLPCITPPLHQRGQHHTHNPALCGHPQPCPTTVALSPPNPFPLPTQAPSHGRRGPPLQRPIL